MFGSGSFPLDWPSTVAALLAALETDAVLVPGHGANVDAAFAAGQQRDLQAVADTLRVLHAAGVPASEAVAAGRGRWPFPVDGMAAAVQDGYRQLDRGAPDRRPDGRGT